MNNNLAMIVNTLIKIEGLHDPSTDDHEDRTRLMALSIGSKIGISPDEMILLGYSAAVHDWGKIFLHAEILGKTSKLNRAEIAHVQKHTVLGSESLNDIHTDGILYIKETILYHHEHWDGGGYPSGRKGNSIPLFARIVCIADVWDAITSDRPYRRAMTKEQALEEMNRCANWFDPRLFTVFLDILREQR